MRFDGNRAQAVDLKITVKDILLLSREERQQLRRLTYGGDSGMSKLLQGSSAAIVIIGRVREKIVGWAVVDIDASVLIYVDPVYRSRGFGKALGAEAVCQARERRSKWHVSAAPHSSDGFALFRSLGLYDWKSRTRKGVHLFRDDEPEES